LLHLKASMSNKSPVLSVVVPVYNEQVVIARFHQALHEVLATIDLSHEIVYCNDGSDDDTLVRLKEIAAHDTSVRILSLSRNFGKEIAATAGMQVTKGQAVLLLDADGQHPVDRIPDFVERWQAGSQVVVGVRTTDQHQGIIKHLGSRLFYKLLNSLSGMKLIPGTTDFCLVDRVVVQDFVRLQERNRITRGLIDWLGYDHDYIYFAAKKRMAGEATYSVRKLMKLAVDGVVSLSVSPLYLTAYIGGIILPLATLLGLAMLVNAVAGDPLNLHATGSAYLDVLLLFLIGILMVSQGIIGIYLSHIHAEAQGRPLYIVDESKSVRI
jgi:glycosyltransferase involved in cell wall biosynthesis